jgi:hypothetical protein
MSGLTNVPSGDLIGGKTSEFLTELLRAVEDLAVSVRNCHGRERRPLEQAADHINRCRFLLGERDEWHSQESPRWPEGTGDE